jgi:hypothetical protein
MHKRLICVATVVLVLGSAVASSAATGPVGWWRLDETSGTTAGDSSPNRNHGTVNGAAAWVAGNIQGALQFDGSNDYVSLPIGRLIQSLSSATFAVWANYSQQGGAWQRVFDFGTGETVNMFLTPAIGGSNTGNMRFAITTGGAGAESQFTAGSRLATGWHHIAVVIDGDTRNVQLYLDDAVVASGTTNTLPRDLGNTTQNWLGRSEYGADAYYQGLLDDLRIYDRALTAEEIATAMAGGGGYTAAANPIPADKATDVSRETNLSWGIGLYAATHDVYLGTSLDDVSSAARANPLGVLARQGQDANSYDPPTRLELGQTYYWRVDEVNAAPDFTIFKGEVWSFTVEPYSYAIPNIAATASSSSGAATGPEKTVDGSGLDANDMHSTVSSDMWLSKNKAPEPAWIQFAFQKSYKLDKMLVWNSNQALEGTVGVGVKDVTVEYSSDGQNWTALGDFEFVQASGEGPCAADTVVDFAGVSAEYVKLTIHSNWYGLVKQYGLSEVRFLYIPVTAREPSPAADATNVHPQVTLGWRAGREAAKHEVYMGADANNLALVATVSTPSYDLAADLLKTYYWQVVEVNDSEQPAAWPSDVWKFSTAEYVTVDDFESYTNDSPKRVFQTWIDGAGFSPDQFFPNGNPGNGSGALVGYDPQARDVMETDLVHGGNQSMPLYYDNSSGTRYSETERTFAAPQDWTKYTITTLVIWFRGDANNVAAPLYAKINGTKVVYNNGAASTAFPLWKQWSVPLSSVPGVNLKSVKSLAIGVGDGKAGGTGTIFIDDIRLYATAPQVAVPANPGSSGLMLLYAMEGNLQDTSGKGNNGTPNGDPGYLQGPGSMGKVLQFDGTNDYVDVPIGSLISTTSSMTIAMFANMASSTSSWQRIFDFGTGTTNYMFLTPRMGTTGAMRFAMRTATVGEQTATAAAMLPPGWHHVAIVIDSAGMRIRLYLDGAMIADGPTTLLPRDLGVTTQNWLGRSEFAADGFYTGLLDDFRIYTRALSEAEVRYLAGDR